MFVDWYSWNSNSSDFGTNFLETTQHVDRITVMQPLVKCEHIIKLSSEAEHLEAKHYDMLPFQSRNSSYLTDHILSDISEYGHCMNDYETVNRKQELVVNDTQNVNSNMATRDSSKGKTEISIVQLKNMNSRNYERFIVYCIVLQRILLHYI